MAVYDWVRIKRKLKGNVRVTHIISITHGHIISIKDTKNRELTNVAMRLKL